MRAVYDLAEAPASWDFACWLASADMERRRQGHDRLVVSFLPGPAGGFRDDQLPNDAIERGWFLDSVCRPMLRLVGATEGDHTEGWRSSYLFNQVIHRVRNGEDPPKFRASAAATRRVKQWLPGRYVTITLRNCPYWPSRNSNPRTWDAVAKYLLNDEDREVVIVPDSFDAGASTVNEDYGFKSGAWAATSIDLRAALYAGAELNLGASNGPLMLLYFGDAPYLVTNQLDDVAPACSPASWSRMVGVKVNEQFPWSTNCQRLAWFRDDSPDRIITAIGELLA